MPTARGLLLAWTMSNGPSRLCIVVLPLLLGACASSTPAAPAKVAPAPPLSAAGTPKPAAASDSKPGAHAVLSTGRRAFVLSAPLSGVEVQGERELLPGGFALQVATGAKISRRFTLVGPEGRCSARATRAVRLSLDFGGYAGTSLPGPKHSGFELEGCEALTHDHSFLIALDGDDPSAAWIHPAHVDEAQGTADRQLGESEVWLHRWALPEVDQEIVERNVLRFVTPSCSDERRDVLIVDELDHPVAQHAGFYLRGALRTKTGTLLVLMGHDEPEALRIVELGAADTHVALDTRLGLFQDVERAEC